MSGSNDFGSFLKNKLAFEKSPTSWKCPLGILIRSKSVVHCRPWRSCLLRSGAVCFGLDHTVISTRRSRLTYGTGVLKRFIRDQHPESKLLRRDGSEWCRDVFDPYVVVDQVVRLGDVVVRRYAPASPTQSYISVTLYSSTHPAPTFTTDDGVTRFLTHYTVSQNNVTLFIFEITQSKISRFRQFLMYGIQRKLVRLVGYKLPTSPEKCHCTTLWNSGPLLSPARYRILMFSLGKSGWLWKEPGCYWPRPSLQTRSSKRENK